jgi:hypothetical protein
MRDVDPKKLTAWSWTDSAGLPVGVMVLAGTNGALSDGAGTGSERAPTTRTIQDCNRKKHDGTTG